MSKIISFFILFSCVVDASLAQNIWGAEAEVGTSEGQFADDFIETGDVNSTSTTSWTALSVNDTDGTRTPGFAYWVRNLEGYSQGAYWGGTTPVSSPSQANGVALFDSDFLDNAGIAGDFGLGSSPSSHRGELISPLIDLTGYADSKLAIKFFTFRRDFQVTELSFSISLDDGASWSQSVDIRNLIGDLTEGFVAYDFPDELLQGVTNLTAVRLRFVFNGDYYFAIIDDVTLLVSDLIHQSSFEQ